MPVSPIQIHPELAARACLSWYWGRVFEALMRKPDNVYWYIDERADPTNFWILLAIAHPEVWMLRKKRTHIPMGHMTKAIRFMKKPVYRAQIEELMSRPHHAEDAEGAE